MSASEVEKVLEIKLGKYNSLANPCPLYSNHHISERINLVFRIQRLIINIGIYLFHDSVPKGSGAAV